MVAPSGTKLGRSPCLRGIQMLFTKGKWQGMQIDDAMIGSDRRSNLSCRTTSSRISAPVHWVMGFRMKSPSRSG